MLSSPTKLAAEATRRLAENDVKSELRDVAEKTVHRLDDVLDKASNYAGDTGRKVRGAIDRTSDNVKSATHHVTEEIRHNPVQSSLIALGAGFILGALLSARR